MPRSIFDPPDHQVAERNTAPSERVRRVWGKAMPVAGNIGVGWVLLRVGKGLVEGSWWSWLVARLSLGRRPPCVAPCPVRVSLRPPMALRKSRTDWWRQPKRQYRDRGISGAGLLEGCDLNGQLSSTCSAVMRCQCQDH